VGVLPVNDIGRDIMLVSKFEFGFLFSLPELKEYFVLYVRAGMIVVRKSIKCVAVHIEIRSRLFFVEGAENGFGI
jgi:hypothetical protein